MLARRHLPGHRQARGGRHRGERACARRRRARAAAGRAGLAAGRENSEKESVMEFEYSAKTQEYRKKLLAFMDEHIYPSEEKYYAHVRGSKRWEPVPIIEELKPKAKAAGLWNLFLPHSKRVQGGGLSNLDYAPLCEIMGRVSWSPEVFNCSAPDTGNMETIERYGTEEQKKQWLDPLLEGKIRSAFLMTEPAVASSDATNIQNHMKREGEEDVINGRKWWSSGAGDHH